MEQDKDRKFDWDSPVSLGIFLAGLGILLLGLGVFLGLFL